jgi:toxin ParE1/3/4
MTVLVISPAFESDLESIADFIARDDVNAAIAFVEKLRRRCNDLLAFPNIGRKRDEVRLGYRSVTEGDYVIFYRIGTEADIVVMRVIHSKRDLGKALG